METRERDEDNSSTLRLGSAKKGVEEGDSTTASSVNEILNR
jgi:hypothetical protein